MLARHPKCRPVSGPMRTGCNVGELCWRLGVSKGSFYHHYETLQQFIEEFLGDWEASFTDWWAAADSVWDPVARINLTFDLVADEMTNRLDAAIRTWAHADPVVARAVNRHDQTVSYATEQTLALLVADAARRRLLARIGLDLWAGMQVRGDLARDDVLELAVEIVRSCWGIDCVLTEENGQLVGRVVPESLRQVTVMSTQVGGPAGGHGSCR